jgi:hypothetical protein
MADREQKKTRTTKHFHGKQPKKQWQQQGNGGGGGSDGESHRGRRANVRDFLKGVTIKDGVATWGAAHERLIAPVQPAAGPSSSGDGTTVMLQAFEAFAKVLDC